MLTAVFPSPSTCEVFRVPMSLSGFTCLLLTFSAAQQRRYGSDRGAFRPAQTPLNDLEGETGTPAHTRLQDSFGWY